MLLALGLLFLGLNKQMDLQTWVIWVGEQASRRLGVYEHRRLIQAVFFAGIALAGILMLVAGFYRLKGQWPRHVLVLLGGAGLTAFLILRVGNFNHVLSPLWKAFPLRSHHDPAHFLELGSIVIIGSGALQALIRLRKAAPVTRDSG